MYCIFSPLWYVTFSGSEYSPSLLLLVSSHISYFRPEPLMTPIYWNLVFTALNIYWICRLLLERLPVKLSADEQRLCELVFRTITPREMIKLLKLATWENAEAGECFVERDKPLDRLMVIYSAKVCAEVDGRNVGELQPGHF